MATMAMPFLFLLLFFPSHCTSEGDCPPSNCDYKTRTEDRIRVLPHLRDHRHTGQMRCLCSSGYRTLGCLCGIQTAQWLHAEAIVRVRGQVTGLAEGHSDNLVPELVQREP